MANKELLNGLRMVGLVVEDSKRTEVFKRASDDLTAYVTESLSPRTPEYVCSLVSLTRGIVHTIDNFPMTMAGDVTTYIGGDAQRVIEDWYWRWEKGKEKPNYKFSDTHLTLPRNLPLLQNEQGNSVPYALELSKRDVIATFPTLSRDLPGGLTLLPSIGVTFEGVWMKSVFWNEDHPDTPWMEDIVYVHDDEEKEGKE